MKQNNNEQKNQMPTSLFKLFIYIIKSFIQKFPQIILRIFITALIVELIHTYLLVYSNGGFKVNTNSKVLQYILNLDFRTNSVFLNGVKHFNIILFWMLVSSIFWCIVAQIKGNGFKVFIQRIFHYFIELFNDLIEKPGNYLSTLFVGSISLSIFIGILLGNPIVTLMLSVILCLIVCANKSSFFILFLYLGWSDLQRFFRVNPRKAFYIDIVRMFLRGMSLGFLIISFFPYMKTGFWAKYVLLFAFVVLLMLNIIKKARLNVASMIIICTGISFIAFRNKLYADDGGWSEGGSNLISWIKSPGSGKALVKGLRAVVSIGIGFIPIVGDIKDAQEVLTGVDLVTGEKLSWKERLLTAGAVFIPVVSGKVLRAGLEVGGATVSLVAKYGDDVADIAKHADNVADIAKHADDVADVAKHADDVADIAKHSDNVADIAKHSDDVADVSKHSDDIANATNKADDVGDIAKQSDEGFTGKLRGEDVTLKDVKTVEIDYVKRDTVELKSLRKEFNSTTRKDFLKDLSKSTENLKKAGLTDTDILKIKNGRVPDGWQVHHKLPLDDGGTNSFENLVLIKNEPYHKVITNYQNSFAKKLTTGETQSVKWPVPEGNIYPFKP